MDTRIVGCLLYVCIATVTGSAEIEIKLIEVSDDVGCLPAITECQERHTQLAFGGLPRRVFSPYELQQQCSSRYYARCLESIDQGTCTDVQKLDIQGSGMAEDYVCSEDGLKQYKKGNEYKSDPWKPLQREYMVREDDMCREKFLDPAQIFMANYRVHKKELDSLPEDEESEKKTEVMDKTKEQREHYCNYMYAYQSCVVQAADRHCNDTIADWQQKMSENYYTPHFNQLHCHIGTGPEKLTIGAIVIASLILLAIASLALFCGVYQKCGEKLQACRRSKNKDDAENGSQRESIVYPDKNGGMPQRTGSRVRFEMDN